MQERQGLEARPENSTTPALFGDETEAQSKTPGQVAGDATLPRSTSSTTTPLCGWRLTNVLIAGRRYDGTAGGRDAAEAVRHFAARRARELKVDISTAIATATQDRLKKVEPRDEEP